MRIVKRDLIEFWGRDAWMVHDNVSVETWEDAILKMHKVLRLRFEPIKDILLVEEE